MGFGAKGLREQEDEGVPKVRRPKTSRRLGTLIDAMVTEHLFLMSHFSGLPPPGLGFSLGFQLMGIVAKSMEDRQLRHVHRSPKLQLHEWCSRV